MLRGDVGKGGVAVHPRGLFENDGHQGFVPLASTDFQGAPMRVYSWTQHGTRTRACSPKQECAAVRWMERGATETHKEKSRRQDKLHPDGLADNKSGNGEAEKRKSRPPPRKEGYR